MNHNHKEFSLQGKYKLCLGLLVYWVYSSGIHDYLYRTWKGTSQSDKMHSWFEWTTELFATNDYSCVVVNRSPNMILWTLRTIVYYLCEHHYLCCIVPSMFFASYCIVQTCSCVCARLSTINVHFTLSGVMWHHDISSTERGRYYRMRYKPIDSFSAKVIENTDILFSHDHQQFWNYISSISLSHAKFEECVMNSI